MARSAYLFTLVFTYLCIYGLHRLCTRIFITGRLRQDDGLSDYAGRDLRGRSGLLLWGVGVVQGEIGEK
jgi:hypothetical protein